MYLEIYIIYEYYTNMITIRKLTQSRRGLLTNIMGGNYARKMTTDVKSSKLHKQFTTREKIMLFTSTGLLLATSYFSYVVYAKPYSSCITFDVGEEMRKYEESEQPHVDWPQHSYGKEVD